MMKLVAIGLVSVAMIALGACDRLPQSAGDLGVGDCFQVPEEDIVTNVPRSPCEESHSGEVFFVADYPAGDDDLFPGNTEFDTYVEDNCISAFDAYTCLSFETDPTYTVAFFTPTREGWDDGDHEISCYIVRFDDAPIVGSLRAN
jgi:hypothetical protein